jgi:hypothetical protein
MLRDLAMTFVVLALTAGLALPAAEQAPSDPAAEIAAQREAMESLAFMDGLWRGPAWTMLPSGEKHFITQTERIGLLLDGSVKLIEGRGDEPDGTVAFNALGIVSFDAEQSAYSLRSYAMGKVGDFTLTLTADGCTWEIPAGPMTIRYTAVVTDSTWREVGDRIMPGGEPARFLEMSLVRLGDTDWPARDPVSSR